MRPCPYPVVTIRWADHWEDKGDFELEDIVSHLKPYYGQFSGHLVGESKQMVAICSNVWEEDNGGWGFSDPMYIMKRAITYRSDKEKGA